MFPVYKNTYHMSGIVGRFGGFERNLSIFHLPKVCHKGISIGLSILQDGCGGS